MIGKQPQVIINNAEMRKDLYSESIRVKLSRAAEKYHMSTNKNSSHLKSVLSKVKRSVFFTCAIIAVLLSPLCISTTSADEPEPSVTFEGGGWGHGVGMSQWGAKAMAEREEEIYFYHFNIHCVMHNN